MYAHPIKRLRHNLDSSGVRFEIDATDELTLLDTLQDLSRAFRDAYEYVRDNNRLRNYPDMAFRYGQFFDRISNQPIGGET